MIDCDDLSASALRHLVWEALKAYPSLSLLSFLEDENVTVRTAAARELQIRGEKVAFDYALERSSDQRDYVREIAAFTLGQLGTPLYPYKEASIPTLVALATADRATDVRSAAVAALGHLRALEGKDAMLRAAEDVEPEVRAHAAFALGHVGILPEAKHALNRLLADSNESVREWAQLGVDMANDSDHVS